MDSRSTPHRGPILFLYRGDLEQAIESGEITAEVKRQLETGNTDHATLQYQHYSTARVRIRATPAGTTECTLEGGPA